VPTAHPTLVANNAAPRRAAVTYEFQLADAALTQPLPGAAVPEAAGRTSWRVAVNPNETAPSARAGGTVRRSVLVGGRVVHGGRGQPRAVRARA
jgi:hypothetical protein